MHVLVCTCTYPLDGYFLGFVYLVDNPAVEKGQEKKGNERGENHPGPVDVEILVIVVQSNVRRDDVRLVRVGPGKKDQRRYMIIKDDK